VRKAASYELRASRRTQEIRRVICEILLICVICDPIRVIRFNSCNQTNHIQTEMPFRKDIESRADIMQMLTSFYKTAFEDELIGRFFTEVVPLDLETHIPIIADFWESILFGTHGYRKNVMEVHKQIHNLSNIRKEHLDRWVEIFTKTVDELFEGDKAILMKQRARSIATLMDLKLNHEMPGKL